MPKSTEEIYRELLAQGQNYQQQANDILSQYDSRPAFAYDPNTDGNFQAMKNQYVHQGRRSMEDTMGQAAGLTGGYNNSYAQSVGNQAYNEHLTQLNAQIPGLAQQARAAYDAEGDRLLDRYNLALNAANTAYGQGRDALGDLRYEQELAYQQGRDALADQRYQDELAWNRDWQQRQWDYNTQQQSQSDARSYATYLLQMGIMPNADQLAAAGMTADEAKKIQAYYQGQVAGTGGSGGSTGGGGYRYTGNGDKVNGDKGNGDAGGTAYDPVQAALDTIRNGTGAAWDTLGLPRNQQNPRAQGTGDSIPTVGDGLDEWRKTYSPARSKNQVMGYQGLSNMVQDRDTRNAGQTKNMRDEILDALYYGVITQAQSDQLLGAIGLKK